MTRAAKERSWAAGVLLAALLAGLAGGASSAEASIPRGEPRGVLLEQPVPLLEQDPLLEVPAGEPVDMATTGGEPLPLFGPGPASDGLFDGVRIPAVERFQAETRYRVIELEAQVRAELERLQTPERTGLALFGGGESRRGSPNRYYDPELGRFISADPLGYVDGPSMYGFASNSPVNYTDPLGLETREEWQDLLKQEMLVAYGVDLDQWDPSKGFGNNMDIVRAVYQWYSDMHRKHDYMHWTGLAKMAGGRVWEGLQMAKLGRLSTGFVATILPEGRFDQKEYRRWESTLWAMQVAFLTINKDIFMDLAWHHKAYAEKGIEEIRERGRAREIDQEALRGWRLIDQGRKQGSETAIWDGNLWFAYREQRDVVNRGYDMLKRLELSGVSIVTIMSAMAESPIPGGKPFWWAAEFPPDITGFEGQRWKWIREDMWPRWRQLGRKARLRYTELTLEGLIHVYNQ